MFWHEFSRILLKSPMRFALLFIVPLFIVTCFFPGITDPAPRPDNVYTEMDAGDKRIDAFYTALIDYENFNTYQDKVAYAWLLFGGQTDDIGDVVGAYGNFFHAEAYEIDPDTKNPVPFETSEIRRTYLLAESAFDNFYSVYMKYIADTPRVFIKAKDYDKFVNGVESLNELFGKEYTNASQLNAMRDQCNTIRIHIDFRRIIDDMKAMGNLTYTQFNDLLDKYTYVKNQCMKMPTSTYDQQLRYIDFCDISNIYLIYHMNRYIHQNAETGVSGFFGFTLLTADAKTTEIARIEYLIENNKTNLDYAKPLTFWGVISPSMGTTTHDFAFSGLEMVLVAIALLGVVITIFCVFNDIKNKTVVGAMLSPHSRRKIIWSKLLACYTAVLAIALLFCVMYFVTSAMLLGTATTPSILVVLFGSHVVTMSPHLYFLLYLLWYVLKLLFIVTMTVLLCMVIKNKALAYIVSLLCAVAVVVIDFFLGGFIFYQIIILPLIAFALITALVGTVSIFRKKDI